MRSEGAASFSSTRRSRAPNNAFDPPTRARALVLAQAAYDAFGPTFLAEKLAEHDGIAISRETLRQWLIAAQLHRPRRRRHQPRPLRERRARVGELIQADGSPHHRFKERRGVCTPLLYVDDATTTILGGLFAEHETSDAYSELFERAFSEHGLPIALYTDKHSIFRINNLDSTVDDETHVKRALRELDVELICANSPQAKDRLERANRTLQDRLVKELRLAKFSTIAAASAFLPQFLVAYNRRFAIAPREAINTHRPATASVLAAILTKRYQRVLASELTFQIHDNIIAQLILRHCIDYERACASPSIRRRAFPKYSTTSIASSRASLAPDNALATSSGARNSMQPLIAALQCPKARRIPPTHPWRAGFDPVRLARLRADRGHL